MTSRKIGTVAQLWRYPVKSMLGESIDSIAVTGRGTLGDRAFALRNLETGNVLSAKKWARLLDFRARFDDSASGDSRVIITMPDGASISADDPAASDLISDALGFKVRLDPAAAARRERAEIDPATVFGDVPVEEVQPGFTAQTLPDTYGLPHGTFFDSAPIHVIASATLGHLRKLQGGTAEIDPRRFRPNIYIATDGEPEGFVEDRWLGGTLCIGEVQVTKMRPALRCVMTTHAQARLPRDLSVLRTAAKHHDATIGVFGSVKSPGTIRLADPVFLLS